jgi:hypothetical protein
MDVNYYLHREQVERTRADQAGSGAARDAHKGLADLYRKQIDRYRAANSNEPRPVQS